MSGICGVCQPGREFNARNVEAMIAALSLPAGQSRESLVGRSIGLGVAQRWPFQQVASIPGVRVAIDAELCNTSELARELAEKGLPVSEMSLAEQIAWLYLQRDLGFINRLHGVFAIALWDEKRERLILGVDRLGVNTLYFRQDEDRVLFAEQPRAICTVQSKPLEINPRALMQYLLFSAVPAPLSIYAGMERIRPGHMLIFEKGRIHHRRYWDLDYTESKNRSEKHWAHELREAMRAAVHANLSGCAPETTGAYLSGGTDSSSVVAFLNEWHSPAQTFSIFFQEERYSEVNFARTTAECFGTKHFERCLNSQDALEVIPKIIQYYDEPFANSSAIGSYYCAQLARQNGVEVLLAGDGGDELFAGNERYATNKYFDIYHAIPAWLRGSFIEPLARLLPQNGGFLSMPARYIRRARISNPERMGSFNFFRTLAANEIFEPGLLKEAPPDAWFDIPAAHFRAARANSELNRLLYLDVKMTLADNDLRKVLGTAEMAGVRVRFPLLDDRLAEFSAQIPSTLKMKGFEKRYIFKKAMRGILPDSVLYKKKHGFGVPLGHWLLRDPGLSSLLRDVMSDARTRQRGYFRPEFLDYLSRAHAEAPGYFGEIVWYLLTLELWHREHLESSREAVFAT